MARRRSTVRRPASAAVDTARLTLWADLTETIGGLGDGRPPADILADAIAGLRSATGAGWAALWLDIAGTVRPAMIDPPGTTLPPCPGLPAESDSCVHVRYGERLLGAVQLDITNPHADSAQLVTEVASAAACLAYTVVVREALQHHVTAAMAQREHLRRARADLVERQTSERQRVASDIHDGCQSRVTVIATKLGLVGALSDRPDPAAAAQIAVLRAELDDDIRDLGDALLAITSGGGPPLLDRTGLAEAIRRLTDRSPLQVVVSGAVDPLPPDVARTAYYCCLEAIQNAARHSGGRTVRVHLSSDDNALRFTVSDDGTHARGPTFKSGAGLTNLRRRVEERGGSFALAISHHGATVSGRLPFPRGDP